MSPLVKKWLCRSSRRKNGPLLFSGEVLPVVALVLSFLLATPVIAPAGKSGGKSIAELKGTISRLQEGIIEQEDKRAQTQITERNILAELEILDKKLATQQEKLDDLEKKMHDQQAMITQQENALRKVREKKRSVEKHLQERMRAYYSMGNIGLLNVTFSTKSLPELLTFHDAFDVLIQYDQELIKAYRQTIDQLVRMTKALDLEKTVLNDFIAQTVQEKETLQTTTTAKKDLLSQVQMQEKLHEQAIIEMQQASSDLTKSIVSAKPKSRVVEQKFLTAKGKLPPPVAGVVITRFHQQKTNALGISSIANGIAIKVADGTTIRAVSDGTVTFSGYLRGFGNTVIIHHGFEYYTVTSRMEKILVKKGQKINQGQSIGITGDTATLFDEGLYFEIRQGSESVNPLPWLNPDKLTIVHDIVPEPTSSEPGTEDSAE